jgi:endothelin-converting enzyme
LSSVDGGWLNAHPLPADKSSFGNFEALGQENKQVIQKILESKSSVGSVDDEILLKLRNFYASCLHERGLDEIGTEPLLHVAKTIRRLYKGNDTDISSSDGNSDKVEGLTTAVAFLHSKGTFCILASLMSIQF